MGKTFQVSMSHKEAFKIIYPVITNQVKISPISTGGFINIFKSKFLNILLIFAPYYLKFNDATAPHRYSLKLLHMEYSITNNMDI